MGSEHQSLLFSYVCSLAFTGKSCRKTLRAPAWNKSVYIKSEQPSSILCTNTLKMIVILLNFAYMTDIFQHLNEPSIKMQGKNENIFTCSDKLKGFKQKIVLWKIELRRDHWNVSKKQSKWNYWKRICVGFCPRTFNLVTSKIWPLVFHS